MGELLLYDIFDKVGDFKFSIYKEDFRPSNFIKKNKHKRFKIWSDNKYRHYIFGGK